MSEDLPHPDNRVAIDGPDIVLHWHRTNMTAHRRLVAKARDVFRAAGHPFVLTHAFDRRTPSHQCGTVRIGTDRATSALDVFCRAHDHANLFVVDAAFLPTSAAVNPSLTIAAQALRVAGAYLHIEVQPLRRSSATDIEIPIAGSPNVPSRPPDCLRLDNEVASPGAAVNMHQVFRLLHQDIVSYRWHGTVFSEFDCPVLLLLSPGFMGQHLKYDSPRSGAAWFPGFRGPQSIVTSG